MLSQSKDKTVSKNGTMVSNSVTAALPEEIDSAQTLVASTTLLRMIQSEQAVRTANATKTSLLADSDEDQDDNSAAVWLILTTKKHITDKARLKPGKLSLPHPILDKSDPSLKICLITADPQRRYKDIIADPSFPLDLSKRIGRVIGITKLKAKYKAFEARRQLLSEYDVFLADDRIITSLPGALGKVFYKTGAKRPIPVDFQGKRQSFDEQGNKRRKLSEGGTKVVRDEVKPADIAHEIERAILSALVHLAPSTTTAVKVGKASMEPQQLKENIEAVTAQMVERYVPGKWKNVRAIHIKGPETLALPIWMAQKLWADEADVLEEGASAKDLIRGKRHPRKLPNDESAKTLEGPEVIEVPGPDGKMRRVEKPSSFKRAGRTDSKSLAMKKRKHPDSQSTNNVEDSKAERAARKEALEQQKAAAKNKVNGTWSKSTDSIEASDNHKRKKKARTA